MTEPNMHDKVITERTGAQKYAPTAKRIALAGLSKR